MKLTVLNVKLDVPLTDEEEALFLDAEVLEASWDTNRAWLLVAVPDEMEPLGDVEDLEGEGEL